MSQSEVKENRLEVLSSSTLCQVVKREKEIMENYFGPVDYVVFGLVLCVSSAIGLYYRFTGGKQKTFKVSSVGASRLQELVGYS